MSVILKREDGHDKIVYDPPKSFVLKRKSDKLLQQFFKYAKAIGLSPEEICIQRAVLPLIVLRVDKREGYFSVFHEGMAINEIKQSALMAYWILKFKPFMINSNDTKRNHKFIRINEGFAFFYILSACKQYAEEKGYETKGMSQILKDELMYALTYWDLSKEGMMIIAETIGEAFFGIPAEGIINGGN